jgi:hypothetical protein
LEYNFFLNIAAHDVSILLLQIAKERESWERKLIARHLALVVYETAEDMTQLLGKPLRDAVQKLGLLDKLDRELRYARQPLDDFWRVNAPFLKSLRTSSAAHRDHDGVALFELIDAIDVDRIFKIVLSFADIQNQLGTKLQVLLNRSAEVLPPEIDGCN